MHINILTENSFTRLRLFVVRVLCRSSTISSIAVDSLFPDEGGGSSDPHTDSSEDEVTEHVTRSTPADMAAARAQVPTISVTPHSPGVLDDSLQQLRRLHAAVQRMRAAPLPLIVSSVSSSSACRSSLLDMGFRVRLH